MCARGGNLHGGLRTESEIDVALTNARPLLPPFALICQARQEVPDLQRCCGQEAGPYHDLAQHTARTAMTEKTSLNTDAHTAEIIYRPHTFSHCPVLNTVLSSYNVRQKLALATSNICPSDWGCPCDCRSSGPGGLQVYSGFTLATMCVSPRTDRPPVTSTFACTGRNDTQMIRSRHSPITNEESDGARQQTVEMQWHWFSSSQGQQVLVEQAAAELGGGN